MLEEAEDQDQCLGTMASACFCLRPHWYTSKEALMLQAWFTLEFSSHLLCLLWLILIDSPYLTFLLAFFFFLCVLLDTQRFSTFSCDLLNYLLWTSPYLIPQTLSVCWLLLFGGHSNSYFIDFSQNSPKDTHEISFRMNKFFWFLNYVCFC